MTTHFAEVGLRLSNIPCCYWFPGVEVIDEQYQRMARPVCTFHLYIIGIRLLCVCGKNIGAWDSCSQRDRLDHPQW